MSKNICRPFILYHDVAPIDSTSDEYDFISFGSFDGIKVCDNLFDNETKLRFLWEFSDSKKRIEETKAYSQILYGFKTVKDETECERESLFWQEAKEKRSFLFVMLLQCKETSLEITKKIYENLENDITKKDFTLFTYLTLDISDIILVISCDSYNEGRRYVEKVARENRKTFDLKYSFTILSINRKLLNEGKFNNKERMTAFISVIQSDLESVDINGIRKETLSLYNKNHFSVLGCEDDLFVFDKTTWEEFIKIYFSLGDLSLSSTVGISNIYTIIGEELSENKSEENDDRNTV